VNLADARINRDSPHKRLILSASIGVPFDKLRTGIGGRKREFQDLTPPYSNI
jgi:hypothetical protein